MGKIILVTTPIGNLSDITERARRELTNAKYILAEDTRNLKSLLGHLEIPVSGKLVRSFHDHNQDQISQILDEINTYETAVLVSDAGSPIVSDPAFPLVQKAIERNFSIESAPGVSSILVALELSGLPPMPFHFNGFLPREEKKKEDFFKELVFGTHLFFESPHRIEKTIDLYFKHYPENKLVLARELTKKFESVYRFDNFDMYKMNKSEINFKGEMVLLTYIGKNKNSLLNNKSFDSAKVIAKKYLEGSAGTKQLSKLLSKILNMDQGEVYKKLLEQKR